MSAASESVVRRPWSHAVAGGVSLLGAIVCGLDWPDFPQNLQHLSAAGIFAWGVAAIFQLVVSAGHFRIAILDWQGLHASPQYERRNATLWIAVQAVALVMIGVLVLLGRNSVLLMADQTEILAALATSCVVSLTVWGMRRKALGVSSQH
ncbi:hypothetical protein LOC68_17060 [Blastopirellula sp. JC732]|uniref:Uncharacterized protein n=1 Tax=Blastopirellula sediminis TaxID=2894196 RepID=A0A9X1MPQ9_9BACT|nr:hypothetical protein [Blastopirellula sediminis]MCC9606598.1 hypothetical protein [Blastopirellula sediminis]MCC9630105.1 hypothetical protein [Blastopirellula sediminis]